MINKIKTKKAFTLAELTVALSIVGVLAAIVVPAVHNMAPNKEMIMFKKAYGEFVRITSEMVNNDDLYPESFSVLSQCTAALILTAYLDDLTITCLNAQVV